MTKLSRQRRSLQTNAAKQRPAKQIILGRGQSYNSEDDFEIISVEKKQSRSQISPKDKAHKKKEVVKDITKGPKTTSGRKTYTREGNKRTAGRFENISATTSSTKMSPEEITVIDSSSENSSPEARTKKPGETRRFSTEQKKGEILPRNGV